MIWKDRLVKIEDGNFMLSAKGDHADFDFSPPLVSNDMALAGNPGVPVVTLDIDEDGELLINGKYRLVGNGCNDYRIEWPK